MLARGLHLSARKSSTANSHYAKRRILKKLGLRRNQPLNFPIPPVLDDFTKLVRLNLERLKDADPKLRSLRWGSTSDRVSEPECDEIQGLRTQKGPSVNLKSTEHPKIKYFPPLERSSDSGFTFDPATSNVTFGKTKVDQDIDDILQTFRDLHSEPPAAELPTSRIRLIRDRSRATSSTKKRPNLFGQTEKKPFATSRGLSWLVQPRIHAAKSFRSIVSTHRIQIQRTGAGDQVRSFATQVDTTGGVGPSPNVDPERYGPGAHFNERKIREHLERWSAEHDLENGVNSGRSKPPPAGGQYAQNVVTQSGEDDLASLTASDETYGDEIELSAEDSLEVESQDEIVGVSHGQDYFKCGDLVELPSAQGILGIFVKNFIKQKCLIYAETGRWMVCDRRKPRFASSPFVPPHILKELLPFLPSVQRIDTFDDMNTIERQSPPRHIGVRAREFLSHFRKTAEDLYRTHADRLDRSYSLLASNNVEDGTRTLSLDAAANELLQIQPNERASPQMLWIVHRTLSNEPNVVASQYNHRQNPVFDVVPKYVVQRLVTVQSWVRDYQETRIQSLVSSKDNSRLRSSRSDLTPIEAFADKARHLVAKSRLEKRACSNRFRDHEFLNTYGHNMPSTHMIQFDETDLLVIDYLRSWTASRIVHRLSPMNSVGPAILRAVGTYKGLPLDQETGFIFLQELSILPPWENSAAITMTAGLPGYSAMTPASKLQKDALQEAQSHQMQDSMADLRKSWGHLPVYCIDAAATTDVDDGLSFETIPDSADVWVHIHVANPTAFIEPESAIARFASHMTQTVYLPERKISMLASKLTEERLSLGQGSPCITFSARVDTQGNVQEDSISHGTVHNVFHLTPEQVDKALAPEAVNLNQEAPVLSVGKEHLQSVPSRSETTKFQRALLEANVSDLRHLRALASAMGTDLSIGNHSNTYRHADKSIRAVETAIHFGDRQADRDGPGGSSRLLSQDPSISMIPLQQKGNTASRTVSHFMVLAGKICGSWCAKRNIPVPYRGFTFNPQPALKVDIAGQDLSAYLQNAPSEQELFLRTQQIQELGFTTWSASPAPHPLLNTSVYVQTTSPLRRYGDMIAHWQIEALLRYEQEQVNAPSGSNAVDAHLPFSHAMVDVHTKYFVTRHWQQKDLTFKSRRHWFVTAFDRAFYSQEAQLPPTLLVKLTSLVNNPLSPGIRGQLLDFWEDVRIETNNATIGPDSKFRMNDVWEVEISSISVYLRTISVRPLRLVEREHAQADTDPAASAVS